MKSKIRVFHLIEDLGAGGAERLLYVNLSRLDRTCFDGIVCHLYDRALHWRQPILDLGYSVVSLGMTSIFDGGKGLLRLRRLLEREPVDLIHTHLYGANVLGRFAGRLRGVPVISSLHNPDYESSVLRDNPALSPRKLGLLRLMDRASCWIGRPQFVAVSEYVRQSAIQHLGISPTSVSVIYNAIDLKAFEPAVEGEDRLRAELGLGVNDPVVFCVARLDPQKGLRYLVEAVPALARQFPGVRVLFAGGGTAAARAMLMRLAEKCGVATHVTFLGVLADVRPYLHLCKVFAMPSLYEGMGIALVEAMAMERPCVASRVGAIPEVVADGRSGLLVPPGDPAALASAIAQLLGDPALRRRLGEEGRRIVEDRFNVDRKIVELERLYERVAERR